MSSEWLEQLEEDLERVLETVPKVLRYCETEEERKIFEAVIEQSRKMLAIVQRAHRRVSFGNLDKFRAEPGDTFILVDGKEMGLPIDVMLFSGETEAHLAEMMKSSIGPAAEVHISDRLKS